MISSDSSATLISAADRALRRVDTGRFRELFELAPCGYYTVDPRTGEVVESNRTLQRLLGYSAPELAGMAAERLFVVEEGVEGVAASLVRQARWGERVEDREVRMLHRQGEEIWVSLSVTPLFDEGGVLSELRLTVVDIRDRKREEGERARGEIRLREAQKLETLGRLAGGVAHEFNNLLMTIMGNAEMVLATQAMEGGEASQLEEIQRASQKAAGLCRQLLYYCGKGRTEVKRLSLSRLVGKMGDLIRLSLPPHVKLEIQLARSLGEMLGDSEQVQQMILNLVTNAGEAIGRRDGTVRVRTSYADLEGPFLLEALKAPSLAPGRYLVLEVSDDGAGMGAETIERIFDPFFSTKFVGRGLGMAAVSGIVRGHGGAIEVESQLDHGSTFRVFLPETAPKGEGEPEAREEGDASVGTHGLVLLAEDETPVLRLARRMLEHLGFKVVAGRDGTQALELFEQHRGDLCAVILDLVMPGMGGEEVLRRIRRKTRSLPIIISSGYTEQEISSLLEQDSRLGFLQKPYDLKTLTATLDRLLEAPESAAPSTASGGTEQPE